MTQAIDLNLHNPFVSTFQNTSLQQQLFNSEVFDLNELLKISITCKTMRVNFSLYKNWQLHILKRLLYKKAVWISADRSYYLKCKFAMYINEHTQKNALAMAVALTEGVVRENLTSTGFHQQTFNRFERMLKRQQQRKNLNVDDIFSLLSFILGKSLHSNLTCIGKYIAKSGYPNALPLAIELAKECLISWYSVEGPFKKIIKLQALQDEPDAVDQALESIDDLSSSQKDTLLSEIAVISANKNDFDKALEIASSISCVDIRDSTLNKIIVVQASQDSDDAIEKALKIDQGTRRLEVIINDLAKVRATKKDPDAIDTSLKMIAHIKDRYPTEYTLCDIAIERSKKDDANRFEEALNLARSIETFGYVRDMATSGIAIERSKQPDPNAIEEALTITNTLRNKMDALLGIAKERAKKGDSHAFSEALAMARDVNAGSTPYKKCKTLGSISLTRFDKADANALFRSVVIISYMHNAYAFREKFLYKLAQRCTLAHLPIVDNPMDIIKTIYNQVHPPFFEPFAIIDLKMFDVVAQSRASENGRKRKKV